MLLTISSTAEHASDLGFLLHKHPEKAQTFAVSGGSAHVFYPEATDRRCTAALLLEVDPVALVRGRRPSDGFSLTQYVNDRPYAASSMLAVAMGKVFRTAMSGQCKARPELPAQPLPLEIRIPVLPCKGGEDVARRVFEPMGWTVDARAVPLDPEIPAWGDSRYVDLTLTAEIRLAEALNHLYVLLPVLDNTKHYWVSTDEVDKLIRAGEGWLATHPERELITRRYLAHRRELVVTATGRLAEIDDAEPETLDNAVSEAEVPERAEDPLAGSSTGTEDPLAGSSRVSLAQQRRGAVLAALRAAGASRVVDLGCGEGALLRDLLADASFGEVLGVDVSHRALQIAARRLRMERMPDRQRERLTLVQSSLTYRDERLRGYDAVVLVEVVEHVDPPRLGALAATVFGHARPGTVVVTTPNVEYNVLYEDLPAGTMRHRDHRFEWTREEFRAWASGVEASHGYRVRYLPVGPEDPSLGSPTQMAVFSLRGVEK